MKKPTGENGDETIEGENKSYGRKGSRGGPWTGISKEKRAQYERIEARVREKMRRGEL